MVKVYENGEDFLRENEVILRQEYLLNQFFILDASFLKETNKEEYALAFNQGDKKLLAMKLKPYNTMVYGDESLASQYVDFILENNYQINGFLTSEELGFRIIDAFDKHGYHYQNTILMDFMLCHKSNYDSSALVEKTNENDIEEIFELEKLFIEECGLTDIPNKETIALRIDSFRVIRQDGRIAAMASYGINEGYGRVSMVYTRKQYRGKNFAREIVSTCTNEIIQCNAVGCLNVDRKNPISNHIYSSIGYEKIFSQGIFEER